MEHRPRLDQPSMKQKELQEFSSSGEDCPECDESFDTKRGLYNHARVHDLQLGSVELNCGACGGTFTKKKAEFEEYDHHYCSDECRDEGMSGILSGENAYQWKGEELVHTCEYCGGEFRRSVASKSDHKFCSRDCADDWRSETIRGETHHNYEGGYSPYYGRNWGGQRQKAIEEQGKCAVCGRSNSDYRAEKGRGMDVHHITPFREFDDYREANQLENLMVVCATCHSLVDDHKVGGGTGRVPAFDD